MFSFGTDGWRGIISREVTFDSVRAVTQAAIDAFPAGQLERGILVGFDRRLLSDRYAAEVAAVVLSDEPPEIAEALRDRQGLAILVLPPDAVLPDVERAVIALIVVGVGVVGGLRTARRQKNPP